MFHVGCEDLNKEQYALKKYGTSLIIVCGRKLGCCERRQEEHFIPPVKIVLDSNSTSIVVRGKSLKNAKCPQVYDALKFSCRRKEKGK